MPIAKATLFTIKAVNGLAGIAQCFLPGTAAGHRRVGGGTKRQWRGVPKRGAQRMLIRWVEVLYCKGDRALDKTGL